MSASTPSDGADSTGPPQRGIKGRLTGSGLEVVKWSNWGKHRLYVNTFDGRRVGWLDLDTGDRTLDDPELESAFESALHEATSIDESTASYVPRRTRSEETDLTGRRPGEHLEAQIAALAAAGRELKPAQPGFEGKRGYSSWELGILGERVVAQELERLAELDPRWAALHSIPVGTHKSDIDHLVVGPGGVFTVNTKHHHGGDAWVAEDAFLLNHNSWKHYVRDSRAEAERAGQLLSVAAGVEVNVTGMVVLVGVEHLTVKAQPPDVRVLDQSELVDFLLERPLLVDSSACSRVLDCARLRCTWL